MGFETGGDIQDPFEDDERNDSEEDTSSESQTETGTSSGTSNVGTEANEQPTDDGDKKAKHRNIQSENKQMDAMSSTQSTKQNMETLYIKDVNVTQPVSTIRLARALMMSDYHEEDPPVPYAVWRDGTSTGRNRTTIELNSDVDELVKQALREFNNRYDADIHKADVRELALTYGLTHLDEVFAMAEEWGIQYNN